MQRRIGQHHAEFIIVWSNSGEFSFCRREDDRPGGRYQQKFGLVRKLDQIASNFEVSCHQRKRFFFTIFTPTQSRDGRGIPSITCEMVSAQSFHSEDVAIVKQLSSPANA